MFQYTRVRYVGFFHDLDRNPFGDVMTEGECFRTIAEAKHKLSERFTSNLPCEVVHPWVDDDGLVAYAGGEISNVLFPAVTEDAYIDLYPVIRNGHPFPWGYVSNEPLKRINFGPRCGVHAENF